MLSTVMAASVTMFDPQPVPGSVPARMPSPFAAGTPHPLAVRAADALRAELASGLAERLGLARDGKMFGVLVVADRAGRIGWLRGFSGMVDRTWALPGFVPPAFDLAARDAFWIGGEAGLDELAARIAAIDVRLEPMRRELATVLARQSAERDQMRALHRDARSARALGRAATGDAAALAVFDRQSNQHTSARDHQKVQHRAERAALEEPIAALVQERAALDGERAARSRVLLVRIHDTYLLADARGERRALRDLFAPNEPPGGAGDCAAPKLLAYAYAHDLRPLALAEMWCGAPPPTGDRRDGVFYPACRGKCGPILGHMLAGLDAEAAPTFGEDAVDPAAPSTLFEDAWLAVVAKPVGLLSVPGRSSRADSVLARLRLRYPDATGPVLVHRLDLDTSGVMLAARDQATYAALQRQFAERTIDKRYVAWLDGEVRGERGTVELPLRVDVDDRPRQIVDPVHGKRAVSDWHVLERSNGRTRVALFPRTGRAHQLRVHASHPHGIGVPIVGDRLYGRPGSDRLMLHAEAIAFVHPHTQERLSFEQSAPF
jgi:tRNA pseudouridine32 synthase/23S rRNA pseudouridine746 synthase